jgi:predicted GNAT family acetyltransferase
VAAGLAWLWDDGGTTVAGASRIGPVYTPPAMRGRGYAGALTAHVSRMVLDEGALACLYTDLANPTSNRLYAAIAYEPVADFTRYLLRPGKPPDRPGAAG